MFHLKITLPAWWCEAQARQGALIAARRDAPRTPRWYNGYAADAETFLAAVDTRHVPAHHAGPAAVESELAAETTASMPPITVGMHCNFQGHEPGDPNRATCEDCGPVADVLRHYAEADDDERATLTWQRPEGGYSVHAPSVLAELRGEPDTVTVVAEQHAWVPFPEIVPEQSAAALPEIHDRMQRTYEVDRDGAGAPVYEVTWSGINDRGDPCAELEPVGPQTGPRQTWKVADLVGAALPVAEVGTSLETDTLVAQWLAEIDADHALRVRESELAHPLAVSELVSL